VKRIESGDWKAKNRPDLKSLVDGFNTGIGRIIDCIMADFPQTRAAV
jgi:hypothetical protein